MLLIRGAMLPDFETGTTTQADVLIRDGRFAAIAPHLEADCPIVEASGLLLLPGMADLHTHMVQSLTQGPLDDLNITQWLTRMLRAQWSLTEDEWYYGVLLGCLRSIRYGVTAINEMTYYPHIDAVVQAYQDAGLRVTFGIGATDIAENDQIRVTPVDECLRQAEELYHKWHGRGLLRTAAVPQGRPACTPELMRALKQFARERGLRQMHKLRRFAAEQLKRLAVAAEQGGHQLLLVLACQTVEAGVHHGRADQLLPRGAALQPGQPFQQGLRREGLACGDERELLEFLVRVALQHVDEIAQQILVQTAAVQQHGVNAAGIVRLLDDGGIGFLRPLEVLKSLGRCLRRRGVAGQRGEQILRLQGLQLVLVQLGSVLRGTAAEELRQPHALDLLLQLNGAGQRLLLRQRDALRRLARPLGELLQERHIVFRHFHGAASL